MITNKLTIGISSPFNPYELKSYLFIEDQIRVYDNNIAASSVHALVEGYLKIGCHVKVFTYDKNVNNITEYHGKQIDIYVIPKRLFGNLRNGTGFVTRLIMSFHLRRIISKHLEDITFFHTQWTYDFTYACIPFASKIPVFCTVRDWCPYIITTINGWNSKLFWKISYYIDKKVKSCKNIHFIANSSYTKERLQSIGLKNIPILPNPIKSDYYIENRTEYPDVPIFISISQSLDDKRKNIKGLLNAFKIYKEKYPNSELWLVGSYSDNFKEAVLEGYSGVKLWGNLKHIDLMKLLDQVSILVHPSFEETFGNIILEAMSRRVPVIGGEDSGAVPLILGKGEYGCVCNVHDYHSIYEAMEKMVKNSEYRNSIIEKSSRYLKNNFLDYIVAQKHIDYFDKYKINKF